MDRPAPLVWFSSAPYDGSRLRAGLDVLMSYAVFAQRPAVLFSGEAVHALVPQAAGADLGRPSLRKIIDSLPLYDVERIWVDADSLAATAIHAGELPDFALTADCEQVRRLLDAAGHVLSL